MHAWYPEAIEPVQWNVVFHTRAASRWSSWIAMGRFKHVSAFAYLQGLHGWVLFDVEFARMRLVVLPDTADSRAILAAVMRDNAVILINRRSGGGIRYFRLGFFCTSAVKHLLGLRGGTLRPDALFRLCLRNGGELIDVTRSDTGHRAAAAGSADRAAAGACGGPEPCCDAGAGGV